MEITREFAAGFCRNCGRCCTDLTLQDRIELLFALRRFVGRRCPHALVEEGCAIFDTRPQVCRNWSCNVEERLMEFAREARRQT